MWTVKTDGHGLTVAGLFSTAVSMTTLSLLTSLAGRGISEVRERESTALFAGRMRKKVEVILSKQLHG